jgi:transcriptional regulator with PAS, ATPase and Fis domain
LIAQASNGTLFLDEIGDMPIHLQSKLLRVIQNRVYRKVGSNKDEEVKCRIIAATHQDLPILIKERRFRLDLYERLSVFTLHIKPLRERKQDIKLLWPDCPDNILDWEHRGNMRGLLNMKLRKEVLGIV